MKIDVEKFKEDFPKMTNKDLMRKFNPKYDNLMELKNKLNLNKNPKYYYFDKYYNAWRIYRRGVYFASFETEEEAKKVVDFLKNNNWNKESLLKNKNKILEIGGE